MPVNTLRPRSLPRFQRVVIGVEKVRRLRDEDVHGVVGIDARSQQFRVAAVECDPAVRLVEADEIIVRRASGETTRNQR